ncbi:882_t:CDS:2 [Racocetra fulgida]|uniref:882_t:CDS:1 n=1 Tax=Racocetra fulgida TaxID=60492 RepID=A0A9N8Z754_9GLOM|nr:882_t:CDS:2 [Racocetra fulgida]
MLAGIAVPSGGNDDDAGIVNDDVAFLPIVNDEVDDPVEFPITNKADVSLEFGEIDAFCDVKIVVDYAAVVNVQFPIEFIEFESCLFEFTGGGSIGDNGAGDVAKTD